MTTKANTLYMLKIFSIVSGLLLSLVLSASAAFLSYGNLQARVAAVEKTTDGLSPSINKLAISVAELTQQMKLHTHTNHEHTTSAP